MFGSYKVKLAGELLERIQQSVDAGSYPSVDEFVTHVLEKEIKKLFPPGEASAASKELVKKRLQGLGYIK